MVIRIILLGDIVGAPGRMAVSQCMGTIRRRWSPDLVIANVENASNGTGLTPDLYKKLCAAELDAMTLGDHAFKKNQIIATLERESNIIRPANLSAGAKGKGWMRLAVPVNRPGARPVPVTADSNHNVYVITVLGRLFMTMPANDPFATVEQVLGRLPEPDPIVLVEIHAEATSEKQAMGWQFSRRVAAVFGTHTHVQTADARILPSQTIGSSGATGADSQTSGTAYVTDLGMCGPHDSVLGRRIDRVLKHMTTGMAYPFEVAVGNPRVQGAYIEIDSETRNATHIETIELAADVTQPPFAVE